MTFDECFEIVIEIEGFGILVNDPADNGGLTKWGISKKGNPELSNDEIKNLTKSKAKAIYKEKYWNPISISKFPLIMRLSLFDAAVNHGVFGGSKLMQKAANADGAGLPIDGNIGPISLAAVKGLEPTNFMINLSMERLKLYQNHEDFARFGRGWTRRLFKVAFEST